jgi:hypothetical protein
VRSPERHAFRILWGLLILALAGIVTVAVVLWPK